MMRSIYMDGSWFLMVSMKFIEILTLLNYEQWKKNKNGYFKKKVYQRYIIIDIYRGWKKRPTTQVPWRISSQVEVKSDGKMRAHLMRLFLAAGPVGRWWDPGGV